MLKKFFIIFFSFLLGLIIFIRVIGNIGWQSVKNALYVFTGWHGLIILILTFLAVIVGSWRWKEILGKETKIPFKRLFGFYLAGYAIMFLAPVLFWGGEIFRAYALKERYSLTWPKSMASVTIDRILEWTINLLVIFFGGIIFLFLSGFPIRRLTVALVGLFLILLCGLFFFYFKCVRKESIVGLLLRGKQNQVIETEKEIFSFFKFNNLSMWRAFFITFLRAFILYLRAFLLLVFLGKKASIIVVLSILGFSYLATMLPVPAALGIHEATQIFVFESFRLENNVAAAFTMIIRWAEIFVFFAGIAALFLVGAELLKNSIFRKIDQIMIK